MNTSCRTGSYHTYEHVFVARTSTDVHSRLQTPFAREIMEGGKNVVRSTYLHFVTNITAWQAPLARDGNELYHTYQ